MNENKNQTENLKLVAEKWDFENSPDNYHNFDQSKTNLMWVFGRYAVFLLLLILIFFPYLRAEVLSYRYSGERQFGIDLELVCNQDDILAKDKDNSQKPPKFKFGKIIEFERVRKSAVIYCLYDNSRFNTIKKLQLQVINQNRFENIPSSNSSIDPKTAVNSSETTIWNVESSQPIKSLYWPIYY